MTRIQELRNKIAQANQIYFNDGPLPVPDYVYDRWKAELRQLCPGDELLTQVGAPVASDRAGQEVRHRHPMGSLDNVYNIEEFLAWHARRQADAGEEIRYNVSFKMDGGSVALFYDRGRLVCAATRGDGTTGENITANAARMKGVPQYVEVGEQPFTGSVRGEVMLFNEDWKTVDPEGTSNPRNLGNGISRRLTGEHAEYLTFVAFRLFNASGVPFDRNPGRFDRESGMLSTLHEMGFDPVSHLWDCTAQDVVDLYNHVQGQRSDNPRVRAWAARDDLPYEIDGLVVKCEPLVFQAKWDRPERNPVTMVAFKFPPRGATTDLVDVTLTVGHTGAIIPTAVLKPVRIGGVTVSSALLCNWEEIQRLGVQIGDQVAVTRRGDVIPKIEAVVTPGADRKPIPEPTVCPECGAPAARKGEDGALTYCQGTSCPAKQIGKITTWIKKLDIQGLGDVYIEALAHSHGPHSEDNMLKSPADLYRLHKRPLKVLADIGTPRLGESRAAAVLAEIEKKRRLPLNLFLGSLGIEGLGHRRVQIVREKDPGQFDTLEDWLGLKLAQRAAEVGLPGTAAEILSRLLASRALIQDLLAAGVEIIPDEVKEEPKATSGRVYCLTGKFPQPKAFYHEKITAAGHSFTEDYKKGIYALVAADPNSGSGKLKKAAKDGVQVLSAEQLLEDIQRG